MGRKRAALMATDPPYLVEYHGGNHPRSLSNSEKTKDKHHADYKEQLGDDFYERFLTVALDVALAEKVAIYQWHAQKRAGLVNATWEKLGLAMHQQIIWFKSRPVLTHSHFMWQHEPCFYGWREGKQPTTPPNNESTVWQIDSKGLEGIHPTEKPLEIFSRPQTWHINAGEVCYEPFSGSGAQLVAAQNTKRACYAMELSDAFVACALERLSDMGLKPKLVDA